MPAPSWRRWPIWRRRTRGRRQVGQGAVGDDPGLAPEVGGHGDAGGVARHAAAGRKKADAATREAVGVGPRGAFRPALQVHHRGMQQQAATRTAAGVAGQPVGKVTTGHAQPRAPDQGDEVQRAELEAATAAGAAAKQVGATAATPRCRPTGARPGRHRAARRCGRGSSLGRHPVSTPFAPAAVAQPRITTGAAAGACAGRAAARRRCRRL